MGFKKIAGSNERLAHLSHSKLSGAAGRLSDRTPKSSGAGPSVSSGLTNVRRLGYTKKRPPNPTTFGGWAAGLGSHSAVGLPDSITFGGWAAGLDHIPRLGYAFGHKNYRVAGRAIGIGRLRRLRGGRRGAMSWASSPHRRQAPCPLQREAPWHRQPQAWPGRQRKHTRKKHAKTRKTGRGGGRGRAYSFVVRLGHLTIDHASISRRGGVYSTSCMVVALSP